MDRSARRRDPRRRTAGRPPTHYVNDTVNYTEPLFVVVIMALASTRPIVMLAESWLRALAGLGGARPARGGWSS